MYVMPCMDFHDDPLIPNALPDASVSTPSLLIYNVDGFQPCAFDLMSLNALPTEWS